MHAHRLGDIQNGKKQRKLVEEPSARGSGLKQAVDFITLTSPPSIFLKVPALPVSDEYQQR